MRSTRTPARALPNGRRLTPQRRLVYQTLAGTKSHPDAEQLITMVRRRDARVSVATVYNTLRLLADAGWIHELRGLGPKTRYDANTGDHDHFTCLACGKVEDIPPQMDTLYRLRGGGFDNYRIDELHVHARGLCAPCATSGAQPDTSTPRRQND
jgi:Fur family transcriptional regulator, peroxide stress response regulator